MTSRSLLIVTLALGSALLGAGIAIHYQRQTVQPTAVQPSPQLQPSSLQPIQPLPSLAAEPQPALTAQPPVSEAEASNEFTQLRRQLRQAIQERNLVLLRSLVRASSLREALRSVDAGESTQLENLDQSAWTVLEKALDYRCTGARGARETCFQPPSPQPSRHPD